MDPWIKLESPETLESPVPAVAEIQEATESDSDLRNQIISQIQRRLEDLQHSERAWIKIANTQLQTIQQLRDLLGQAADTLNELRMDNVLKTKHIGVLNALVSERSYEPGGMTVARLHNEEPFLAQVEQIRNLTGRVQVQQMPFP